MDFFSKYFSRDKETVPLSTLQSVNEEMYKRNAELVRKNKILSLLGELYTAGASSFESMALATAAVRVIGRALSLPFTGIATVVRPGEVYPYACHLSTEEAPYVFSSADKDAYLFSREISFEKGEIEAAILTELFRLEGNAILSTLGVCRAFPLGKIDGGSVPYLLLGFPKESRKMDDFESEAMVNAVQILTLSFEKTGAYENLAAANDRLRHLDEMKTEFVSIASHQLRTPLSIIKGYISLLEEGAYGAPAEEMKKIFKNIDESNERLVKLVDQFLDVSRLEQGRTQYSFGAAKIEELVRQTVERLEEKAMERGVRIDAEALPSKLPSLVCDSERILHVLQNLFDNAIKYSPEGGLIRYRLAAEKGGVVFDILDQGPGLDEEDKKNLFQKFYRSPHVLRDFQGTGLGLYVVKEFVAAHGGRVFAKSEGLGKGSEFGFWIPGTPTSEAYLAWQKEEKTRIT